MLSALVIFAGLVGLAVVAGKRAAAERARAEKATEELVAAERKREAVLKDLSRAEAVATSREFARQANEETENKPRLQKAIQSGETAATDAAREALINAIQKVMEGEPGSLFAVNTTGNLIALAGGHGQGVVVDLKSGTITNLCGSPERIGFLSFSPNSRYLLIARHHHHYRAYLSELTELPVDEYQLWDTVAASPLGSAVVNGTPLKVRWAPNSSMFIALQDVQSVPEVGGQAYRMSIGPSGSLTAVEQAILPDSIDKLDIVFSKDRQLFLMYSRFLAGASLWDYHGNKLWSSSQRAGVDLAAFRNHSSRVVIGLMLSGQTVNTWERGFEVVDLGPSGRVTGPSNVYSPEQFDYSILGSKGATNDCNHDCGYNIGRSLRAKNPDLLGEHGCGYETADLAAGLVFCAVDKTAGYLFDVATQKSMGALERWMIKDTPFDATFARGGKILVVFRTAGEQIAGWDTSTRNLLWSKSLGVSSLTVSPDGERILVYPWPIDSSSKRIAIDPQTGHTVGTTSSLGEIEWVNRSATRLMTSELAGSSLKQILRLLDFDHSAEPRQFELMTADKAELEQDMKTLKENPSIAQLLVIARRRLRACDSSLQARP
jgi:WD40 repeat protein